MKLLRTGPSFSIIFQSTSKWVSQTSGLLFCLIIFTVQSGCITSNNADAEGALLHLQIGVSMLNRNMYPQAYAELLQAEKMDPTNPSVQNNLGLASHYRQRPDLAEKYFKRAIQLNSKYSEARTNYARLLIEIARLDEAESQLKVVIDDLSYTGFPRAYLLFGMLRFKQNNFVEAIRNLNRSLDANKENCEAVFYLGRSFLERGDNAKAAEALDRSINFCEASLGDEPLYYSALAHYRLGQKEKSLARFNDLQKKYPNGANRDKAQKLVELIRKVD